MGIANISGNIVSDSGVNLSSKADLVGGLVPSSQLPSYVDDVLEYANLASFPATGETGKIYVDLATNKIYRWSGTVYIEISSSAGGGGTWGSITGTLSNQTDLQAALNAKQDDLNGTGFVKASGTTITYDNSTYYPQPTGTTAQYITGDGTLATFPSSIASASQLTTFGRNSTGATLYRGTIVYISGATGNIPNFSKSQANGEGTSARTFGVVKDDIANNADGYIVTNGTIDNLDTRSGATYPFTSDTLVDGDTVYLDPTTAGYITRTKPSAPNHLVYIGKVIRTSPTNGTIVYQIQNGYELDELHDVQIGSYVNKDVLYRDTTTNLWKNASIATVLGYTPYDASNPAGYTTNVGTVTSVAALTIDSAGSDITSSVADGTTTPVITLSVPDASTIARGVVNNGTQTFGGAKTFSGNLSVINGSFSVSGNTTLTTSTGSTTIAIATEATVSGATKTINIGTAGLSGSTTNITIGSTAGTNAVTARGTWTFAGNITAATIIKSGGTSSQFLKADGSVDSNTYLTSFTETDPIYTASSWYTTTNNASNWNTAYGWGNHASAGYLTTSSAASTYQPLDADLTAIAGLAGTSGFLKKTAANTWSLDTSTYLTSYTETDPVYVASSWYTTTNNASNWNTAYGWGNHASAGYLTSITSSNVTTALGYTPVTNARTLTINGTTYDLTANRSWTISGSDSTKLPLAGGTMTGQIVSTVTEVLKMTSDNCYISGWNTAGTTRYGYLQFGTGSLNLFSEAGAALNIGANSTSRIYISAAGNTGMGTTSPLSMLHLYGGTFTVNSSGTSDVAGGMRIISHSVKKVGGAKFIKIYAGTNNYFTGFIFGYNFDDYPPNSATNTGAGFSYQFGGWSDGSGACGDKYFDLTHFGGNNVGNMGREMNTDGNGYILTSPTNTGAGGYKCSATIMLFARDMSKISITYY